MIADLNKKGLIDRKETLIASLVTSFPATFIFVRDLLPVLIILLGTNGVIYLGIVVAVGLLHTGITCPWAHFTDSKEITCNPSQDKEEEIQASLTERSFGFMVSP